MRALLRVILAATIAASATVASAQTVSYSLGDLAFQNAATPPAFGAATPNAGNWTTGVFTGAITGSDGIITLPAITGTDTDTGWWFPAGNSIALSTGGAERYRYDTSGRLLQGLYSTSTLTATALTVNGTAYARQFFGTSQASAGSVTIRGTASSAANIHACAKTRSTDPAIRGIVSTNDGVCTLEFDADDGTLFDPVAAIKVFVEGTVVAGTPGPGITPGRIDVLTTNSAGTSTQAVRINSAQQMVIGSLTAATGTASATPLLQIDNPNVTGGQLALRSQRAAIVSTNVLGGIDFESNDTSLTAPGSVTAKIQARATQTQTGSALGTSLVFSTIPNTTITLADSMTLDGNGNLSNIGSQTVAQGEIRTGIVTDTDTATILITTRYELCNKGTAMTVTMPATGVAVGQRLDVKNIGAGACTIQSSAGNTIDGAQTRVLSAQYDGAGLLCTAVTAGECDVWLVLY